MHVTPYEWEPPDPATASRSPRKVIFTRDDGKVVYARDLIAFKAATPSEGRIRHALTGLESFSGRPGKLSQGLFDPFAPTDVTGARGWSTSSR